jgi:diketogulonate reductase-like aldo/keto reductase
VFFPRQKIVLVEHGFVRETDNGSLLLRLMGQPTYAVIMLHYPGPDDDSIRGQWKAFDDMHEKGLVKTLSVSNFSPRQLDAVELAKVKPVVNKLPFSVAYHPATRMSWKRIASEVSAWCRLGLALANQ